MNYLPYILENNLAISRFMLDHAIILLSIIPFSNKELRIIYKEEKILYEQILLETISYSYNNITKKFITSEILITNYTILMENKTCELYKIKENKDINISCLNLILNSKKIKNNYSINLKNEVDRLNGFLLISLKKSLESLNLLHSNLIDGNMTIFLNLNFIKHLIDEVEIYIYTLNFFERKLSFTPTFVYTCNYYFTVFLEEHTYIIKNMMFPVNGSHIKNLECCEKEFKQMVKDFNDDISPGIMHNLNKDTKDVNDEFTIYNVDLIQSVLHNNFYTASIPLLNDHILRESNYLNYQLDNFSEIA